MSKDLNYDGCLNLLGAIIQVSLYDLLNDTSKIKSKAERKRAERNKLESKLFFEKSNLFKITGLDLNYLIEHYKSKKGKKSNYILTKGKKTIRKNFDENFINAIKSDYANGLTYNEIIAKYHTSTNTISKIVHEKFKR